MVKVLPSLYVHGRNVHLDVKKHRWMSLCDGSLWTVDTPNTLTDLCTSFWKLCQIYLALLSLVEAFARGWDKEWLLNISFRILLGATLVASQQIRVPSVGDGNYSRIKLGFFVVSRFRNSWSSLSLFLNVWKFTVDCCITFISSWENASGAWFAGPSTCQISFVKCDI